VIREKSHICQPDLRGKKLGLIGTGALKQSINTFEHLLRLGPDVAHWVRRYAAQIHNIAMNNDSADDGESFSSIGNVLSTYTHYAGLLRCDSVAMLLCVT
jgi:hypothetical protein